MAWTCTDCGRSEPFDPPQQTESGEAICEECADE